MTADSFTFAKTQVPPATRERVELPAGRLPSGAELTVPVEVLHGARPGPAIWLSGAIHGDEIVGVEIIRQVIERLDPAKLTGTVVAVPIVNVFGFVAETRYLPDRRDLNRSFPGSKRGSMAGRLARMFVDEVVDVCAFGLDFHAGSDDRTNLPQVRGNLDDRETRAIAIAFGAPLAIHSKPTKGTLRQTALRRGKRVLLFEGGEPRRFSPRAVDAGVAGALRVMGVMGMIDDPPAAPDASTHESRNTLWVRAARGGVFRLETSLGAIVEKGQRMGVISGPMGRDATDVSARASGMVMGHAVNPLVHRGDALVHIAELD